MKEEEKEEKEIGEAKEESKEVYRFTKLCVNPISRHVVLEITFSKNLVSPIIILLLNSVLSYPLNSIDRKYSLR